MLKEWNMNSFQIRHWTVRLEEEDPLDAQSYAGGISPSCRVSNPEDNDEGDCEYLKLV
jgi:hypothetical protein